jgi:hypothetical protein
MQRSRGLRRCKIWCSHVSFDDQVVAAIQIPAITVDAAAAVRPESFNHG